jgi:hypothetical protein
MVFRITAILEEYSLAAGQAPRHALAAAVLGPVARGHLPGDRPRPDRLA